MAAVVPGDRLGSVHEFSSGSGTYVRGGHVYASVVGLKAVDGDAGGSGGGAEPSLRLPLLSVMRVGASGAGPQLPAVGNVVTARVVAINARAATVQIVCLEGVALPAPFAGVVRKENLSFTDIDRILMENCMRPGDVILAEVISLGDSRSYFLTVAKPHLGVVFAKSGAGVAMDPVSAEAMECPVTHVKVERKVALLSS